MRRYEKTFRANIFPEGEERAMTPQIIDRRSYPLINPDLLHARIAFDINNAIACEQIVVEFLRPANIQNRVRFAIELTNPFQRKARRWLTTEITRAERPAILEFEFACQSLEKPSRLIKFVFYFEFLRVVG